MKKIWILGICFLAACSGIKVTYDFDNATDFSKFKTYAYAEEALNLPVQELDRNRILAAIDKQMTAKGFSKSSTPDVLIDLQVKLEQKTEATATNNGGMYYGRGYRYGGGFTTTTINVENYVVGTLFINMVDRANGTLAWQGRGTRTLAENPTPQKKQQNIDYAVAEIFKQYPPKGAK